MSRRQQASISAQQKRHRSVQTQKSHRFLHTMMHEPLKSFKFAPRERAFHPLPASPTRVKLALCSKTPPSSPTTETAPSSPSTQFPDDKALTHAASGAGLSDGDVSGEDDDDLSANHGDFSLESELYITADARIDDLRLVSPTTPVAAEAFPISADSAVSPATPPPSALSCPGSTANGQAQTKESPPAYMDPTLAILMQHLPGLVKSGLVKKCRAAGMMHYIIMQARSIRKAPAFHPYEALITSRPWRDAALAHCSSAPHGTYGSSFAPQLWQPSGRSRQGCCLPYQASVVGSPMEDSFLLYCIVKQYATNEWLTQDVPVDPVQLLNACIDMMYPRYNRPVVLRYGAIWRSVAGKGDFPLGTLRLWIRFPCDCDPDAFLMSMSGSFLMDRSGVWFDASGASLRAITDAYATTKSQDLRHALTNGLPTGAMIFERGMGLPYP